MSTIARSFAAQPESLERAIRVNALSFGAVMTPMTGANTPEYAQALEHWAEQNIPIKRWAEPSEAAKSALFLASQVSSYMNGSEVAVDGGLG